MVQVLRIGHRISRDKRISTHVCLVARAFGSDKIYYSGQKDSDLEKSVTKIVNNFGGNFEISYVKNYHDLIKQKKKQNFKIVHLTMYGEHIEKIISKIKKKNILFVVGGEKVPGDIYELSNFNVSVSNQPHSEVSSLAVSLYEYFGKDILTKSFNNYKLKIIPQKIGKKIVEK